MAAILTTRMCVRTHTSQTHATPGEQLAVGAVSGPAVVREVWTWEHVPHMQEWSHSGRVQPGSVVEAGLPQP